ncbi:hypothetical protein ACFXKC_25040 [Streptomyces sp. NPDC059340]|uniref:MmyB family transcriptional regulator n=1 Tax=Streptomyces sp. NPDC059340 TaxID=3346806 RepID=UPI0036949F30
MRTLPPDGPSVCTTGGSPTPPPGCSVPRAQLGTLEPHCQTLVDPDRSQRLLVCTAAPGSESHARLQLLSVVGSWNDRSH